MLYLNVQNQTTIKRFSEMKKFQIPKNRKTTNLPKKHAIKTLS